MKPRYWSTSARYAFAVLLILLTLAARWLLDPVLGKDFAVASLFIAILVAAGLTGFGPAILVSFGGLFAISFFFPDPNQNQDGSIVGLISFLAISAGIAFLGARMGWARRGAENTAEELRTTLHSIGDAVLVCDSESRIKILNPVAELLTGWTSDEAQGQPLDRVFRIINQYTRETVESPVAKAIRQGTIVGLANHTLLIAKDGSETAVDDSAAPIRDEKGAIIGVILVFRDVTQRRRAAEAQRQLAAIVESSTEAIVGKSLDGNITSWNAAAEALYGYSAEEILGRPFSILVPEDRQEEVAASLQHLRNGERVTSFETIRQHRSGRRLDVALSYFPILDESGNPASSAVTAHDIGDRKRTERRRVVRSNIAQILAQAETVEQAAPPILKVLCQQFDWSGGALWAVNAGPERPRSLGEWSGPQAPACVGSESDGSIDEHLQALAQQVLDSGQPIWNRSDEPHGPPEETSEDGDEICTTAGFPVLLGTEIKAVLTLFTSGRKCEDEEFEETLAMAQGLVALFIERREANARLQASERELAEFFESASVGLHCVGPHGEILRVNQAELDLLRYSREEYLGRNIAEFHVDPQVITDALVKVREGQILQDFSAQMRASDGKIKDVLLDFSGLFRNGQFIHARCFTRDVSARKQAQESLQENMERLRLALEAGQMGVWDLEEETQVVRWSGNLGQLSRFESETWTGAFEDYLQFVHPDDRERVTNTVQRAFREDAPFEVEHRNKWPDGGVHWFLVKGHTHRREGQSDRVIAIEIDVTRRKTSEETARFLSKASAALSSIVDHESTLQLVANLAVPFFADWCAIDLLTSDDHLQRVAVSHVDPQKIALVQEIHARYPADLDGHSQTWAALRTGQSRLMSHVSDEDWAQRISEPERLQLILDLGLRSLMVVPMLTRGRAVGVMVFAATDASRRFQEDDLAIAEDLAQRAAVAIENTRLYHQLRDADRRKDEFLAMLAHELRNPLAPIRSGLELLSINGRDEQETIQLMQDQVGHLVRLVDDLLDVSRIVRGKIQLRKEPVSINRILARSVAAIRPTATSRNQELQAELLNDDATVEADPVRLTQIVENLLNNASKYSESGGRIELRAEVVEDNVVIAIEDNGIGIEEELLPHVFDLFTQSSRALDRSQGGLGIGLTLVRNLVELHGGSISVHSEGPGRGSIFRVTFPIDRMQRPADEPAEHTERPQQPRRILVVDDNRGATHLLKRLFESLGQHEVEAAHDGHSAIERAREFQPHVVLLDIGLPGMDGYEVCRQLRQFPEYQHMTIVALTGYGQEEDRRLAFDAGFHHHWVKPVGKDSLLGLLNNLHGETPQP